MAVSPTASPEAPPPKRGRWSLRGIVEDVSGHPISHFQDPPPAAAPSRSAIVAPPPADDAPTDPADHVYPPLSGAIAREFHGPQAEHHLETIARHPARTSPRGPSVQPERLYLHYLLLHLDRLSDAGLRYLARSVEEEEAHRRAPATVPRPPTT